MDDRPAPTARGVVIAVLLGIVLFWVCAEIALSFYFPPGLHFIHPQTLLQPDTRRVYSYRPNQQAYTIDKRFRTNSLGFREREIPVKPEGEFRILSLGDSIGVGLGVEEEETYARVLEDLLRRRDDGIRVYNAATESYSYWQEVDLLKEKGISLEPDLVVMGFFWNDLYHIPKPVQPITAEQSGEERDVLLKRLRLLKRSRTLLLLRERWNVLKNRFQPSFDWEYLTMIQEGGTTLYLKQAYAELEATLAEFRLLADAHGFTPVFVVFPTPTQVLRPEMPTHLQDRVREIAEKNGLEFVDMAAALRAGQQRGVDLYVPWDNVHFAPPGHALVAEELASHLTRQALLRPP